MDGSGEASGVSNVRRPRGYPRQLEPGARSLGSKSAAKTSAGRAGRWGWEDCTQDMHTEAQKGGSVKATSELWGNRWGARALWW